MATAAEEPFERLLELVAVDQEGVVTVRRIDLDVLARHTVGCERVVDLLLLVRRVEHVAPDADRHRGGDDAQHRPVERAPPPGDVVEIHRLADREVTVRVEPSRELLAVVLQVTLHLETLPHPQRVAHRSLVGEFTSEPVGEDVVTAKRDLRHHSGDLEPLTGPVTRCGVVVVAAVPLGVEPDRSPPDRPPRDLLRGRLHARGDRDE